MLTRVKLGYPSDSGLHESSYAGLMDINAAFPSLRNSHPNSAAMKNT